MSPLLRTPDPAVERVLARWAVAAAARIGDFTPDVWDTWATRGLVASIVQNTGVDRSLTQYVIEREQACFTREEILIDLACLADVDARAALVVSTPETGVAVADTYRSSAVSLVLNAWAQLPGVSYLSERLAEEYRRVRADGGRPSEELWLTCVDLPRTRSLTERMALSLEVSETLREQYPRTPVACLSHVRFVSLCLDGGGDGKVTSAGLPQGAEVTTLELPESAEAAARLLAQLEAAE